MKKKNRVSNYSNLNFFLDRKKIGEVVFDIQKIITAIKKCKKNKKKIKKTINLMIKNNRLFLNSYTRTLNFLSKI